MSKIALTYSAACAVLGVSFNSDEAVAKSAFRRLTMLHHPDGRQPDAKRFQDVAEAWAVIKRGKPAGEAVKPPYVYVHMGPIPTSAADMFTSTFSSTHRAGENKEQPPMGKAESAFSAEMRQAIEGIGGWTFKKWGNVMEISGVPDRYVTHSKWTGWIEEKVNGFKLSAVQRHVINDMHKRGGAALVVRLWQGSRLDFEYTDGTVLATLPMEAWNIKGPDRGRVLLEKLNEATQVLAQLLKRRIGDWKADGSRVQ
jgi:hypothetical protein